MSLSCSEIGLPFVASIISVLQHRATDLLHGLVKRPGGNEIVSI